MFPNLYESWLLLFNTLKDGSIFTAVLQSHKLNLSVIPFKLHTHTHTHTHIHTHKHTVHFFTFSILAL